MQSTAFATVLSDLCSSVLQQPLTNEELLDLVRSVGVLARFAAGNKYLTVNEIETILNPMCECVLIEHSKTPELVQQVLYMMGDVFKLYPTDQPVPPNFEMIKGGLFERSLWQNPLYKDPLNALLSEYKNRGALSPTQIAELDLFCVHC